MKKKAMIAAAAAIGALCLAAPGQAGAVECTNTNNGSISIGQGTAQCNDVFAGPVINLGPNANISL